MSSKQLFIWLTQQKWKRSMNSLSEVSDCTDMKTLNREKGDNYDRWMLTSASQRQASDIYMHICTPNEDDCNGTDVLEPRMFVLIFSDFTFHFTASTHVKDGWLGRDLTIIVIISFTAGNQTAKKQLHFKTAWCHHHLLKKRPRSSERAPVWSCRLYICGVLWLVIKREIFSGRKAASRNC